MKIGEREFKHGKTYIMGILNTTPDSFSDGGSYTDPDSALFHAEQMLKDGADVIDVGGMSTRPGHSKISVSEEIKRTAGIIERIKSELGAIVSIDTYRSKVAEAALEAGADIVNDVWGLKADANMAGLIARKKAVCVIMHNREEPVTDEFLLRDYIRKDMEESIKIAHQSGIADDNIILDPGIGFGKTYEQNLRVLAARDFMMPGEYPVLLGTSRKSVIGKALDLPVEERLEGTLVTTVLAACAEALFVRVHDVRANSRAIRMYDCIRSSSYLR